MNKLTDDVREGMKEAFDNLVGLDPDEQYKLFLSEQAGWEEVERLRKLYERERDIADESQNEMERLREENARLKEECFDYEKLAAHNQSLVSEALRELEWYTRWATWGQGEYKDGVFISEGTKDGGKRALAAIQRIQEETANGDS